MGSEFAARVAELTSFIEQVPAAIALFDAESRYVAVSRSFLVSILDVSVSPSEMIGRCHYGAFPNTPTHWRKFHARVLAGEEVARAEYPLVRRDGRIEWVRWSMKPWHTSDERICGALMAAELITDLVDARRFAAEGTRLVATFDNAAIGMAHVAPDGRFLRANEALCREIGYPVGELLTKSFQDVTYPDDFADEVSRLELMHQGKIESYDSEARYLRKDGATIWCRKTVGCVRKVEGSIDYFVSTMEDISARKQAEKELRANLERFRSSLVHSPLPLLLFDDRENILVISQSWLELSGYCREDLRRVEDWTVRAYGERSDATLDQIRRIFLTSAGPPEVLPAAEQMVRTRDGRERIWSFVYSALPYQFDGRRLFISVAEDVTDQNAHLEQVHLLMREIDHRARNMLSVVQAIASQTAARDPHEFIERLTGRIQALAANQELLARNEWQGVDAEDLVRVEVAHFSDLVGSRIMVHGSPLRLNPTAAQAIGLALYELATNAGKYGALSVDAGRVDVCWESKLGVFTMSWTERDGPLVRPPEHEGFGTTVVDGMAGQALGAEVQLDYGPSGLEWRLTCPAPNALAG